MCRGHMYSLLRSLALVLFFSSVAQAQFNAAAGACAASTNAVTFELEVASCTDCVIVVGATGLSTTAATVSTVTFNGDALAAVSGAAVTLDDTVDIRSEQWFRVAPDVATGDVVVTFNASINAVCAGAVVWDGLDQGATPYRTPDTQTGTSGTTPTLSVESVADDIVIDTIGCNFTSCNGLEGAGQTLRASSTTTTQMNADVSTKPATGDPTAMTFTISEGDWWAYVGTAFIPASAPSVGGSSMMLMGVGQ